MLAIEHAHRIITWRENLSSEEMPPTWMWHLERELDSWFKQVEKNREDSRPGGGGDEGSSGGVQNELTKGMRD